MGKPSEMFQSFIKTFNVFTSPVNLRYKLDTDYNTFAGGMISIMTILLLMSIFYNSWIALLDKTDISSSTETIKQFDPSLLELNSEDFMFGIGVSGMNISNPNEKKYFDFSMKKVEVITTGDTKTYNKTIFPLEPCRLDHWEHLGPEFAETYTMEGINTFLCPPRNTSMEIGGKWTSKKFAYFQINFDVCRSGNCRTQAEIDEFIRTQKAFYFDFFYSNTLLNPDQVKPISMLLEDKDYAMCSPKLSTLTNMYLGEYTMITDESIFPWITQQTKKGFIVNRAEKEVFNSIPEPGDAYCRLYLRKSNEKFLINRSFRKLDDMLSYIGGLFGLIAAALGIVVKYYGQCSFQLEMCQKIFDYHNKKQNQDGDKNAETTANGLVTDLTVDKKSNKKAQKEKVIEPKDFGFLDFFIHILIYLPLKKLCKIKWKKMQVYEESLEEMRHKLDISQMIEKQNFYDRSINALFDDNQLKLLYLQDKFDFEEVREERKMLGMKEDFNSNLMESREITVTEGEELLSPKEMKEHKKSLKEIADGKHKRKLTSGRVLKFGVVRRDSQKSENYQNVVQIPVEIKQALERLDEQIEDGDVVSTRIYNRLQYELLEAYEKAKQGNHEYTFIPVTVLDYQNDIKRSSANSNKIHVKGRDSSNEGDRKVYKVNHHRNSSDFVFNPNESKAE